MTTSQPVQVINRVMLTAMECGSRIDAENPDVPVSHDVKVWGEWVIEVSKTTNHNGEPLRVSNDKTILWVLLAMERISILARSDAPTKAWHITATPDRGTNPKVLHAVKLMEEATLLLYDVPEEAS